MNYVLVTGASAGIGETFARELAKEGENLILVARREERLSALASDLMQTFGVSVETLAADLSSPDGVDQVIKAVASNQWQLRGLINNAGFGDRGQFHELSIKRQLDMIQVNVTSLVALTHHLIDNLRKTDNSFIINVASTAAFQAGPGMAIYYATKAFVLSFSEALHEELKASGVSVSALCPGATSTEFAAEANMTNTRLFKSGAMSAEDVVREALTKRGQAIVISGLRNRLMVWLGKFSPRLVTRRLAGWLQA